MTIAWSRPCNVLSAVAKPLPFAGLQAAARAGRDGLASSVNLLLPDAEKTGNLTSIANAVVREMTVDKNTGLPNGCNFVDRLSHREMSVKARVVVLAAGTLESTRLLLNSKLANSSGVLGHYLMDQIYGAGVVCSVPEARNGKANEVMGVVAIVPRFRNIETKSDKFLRGYALECLGADRLRRSRATLPLTARSCSARSTSTTAADLQMTIMGEVLGRYENHVRIDKDRKADAWGIPVLHVETKLHRQRIQHGEGRGGGGLRRWRRPRGSRCSQRTMQPNPPGYSIHEVGTCRMGERPEGERAEQMSASRTTTRICLWWMERGFTSAGWQNPTMTILSLSMRASEYLADEMKKQNI